MEMKLVAFLTIGLVIGLICGLAVGYSVVPKAVDTDTTALEQQISQLQGQVSTLQDQIQEKDSQISNLTSQIAELEQLIPPLTKGEWNTIKTFIGSASKTTELFYIPSETWRINWTYTGGSLAIFGFFVYPEGETILYVESLSTMGASQSDVTYIYEGPESFYVKLVVANIDQWTLKIQAFVPS
jgi:hypothetical protein